MAASSSSGAARAARRKAALMIAVVIIICAALYFGLLPHGQESYAPAPPPAGELRVTFIDVGQADSILVTFDTGETMLIDAGEKSSAAAISRQLDAAGVTRIDVLVATHPHADHIGGMTRVIERYEIGRVYMPDMKSASKTYTGLIAAIQERGIPVTEAYAGLEFAFGPAVCTIVSPHKDADIDANNESVVIFLDYAKTDFLFTGDMEERAEAALLEAGYDIDADVLKAGHHGSRSSTSDAFLREVSPEYAVISCGTGNSYGHPHKETLELLEAFGVHVLRTDLSGDILFVADGRELTVSEAR